MSTNTSAIQNKLVVSFSQSTQSLFSEDPSGFQLDSSLNKFYSTDYSEEETDSDNDDDDDDDDDDCINYSIEAIGIRYMHLHARHLEESSRYKFPGPEHPDDEFIIQRYKYAEMCPVGALGFYFLACLNHTDSQKLIYQNISLWFHQLAIESSSRKAVVECANYAAQVYSAAPGDKDDRNQLCRFNAERLEIALPPRSLLLPTIPQWILEFRTDCVRDDAYWSEPFVPAKQALSEYTEFVVYLVRVALQDGAVLYLKNPRHPLLNTHGVFQSAQFKAYVQVFKTKAQALKPRQLRACA